MWCHASLITWESACTQVYQATNSEGKAFAVKEVPPAGALTAATEIRAMQMLNPPGSTVCTIHLAVTPPQVSSFLPHASLRLTLLPPPAEPWHSSDHAMRGSVSSHACDKRWWQRAPVPHCHALVPWRPVWHCCATPPDVWVHRGDCSTHIHTRRACCCPHARLGHGAP